MPGEERRWNGWGRSGEAFELPAAARVWLAKRLGEGDRLGAVGEEEVAIPEPRALPPFACETRRDRAARLRNACGQSFPDLIALRTGRIAAFPDAVLVPADAAEVVAALRAAAAAGVRVVVRGGGTSVVGGVTLSESPQPCVVLSLERLTGLVEVDDVSRLARLRAGTLGPDLEAALAAHRLRLGHEPQSFELSTLGGWIVTRSAGQRSTGIGKIEELVAGVEVATAEGLWRLAAQPSSAAGPELRRLVIGSEGRFGVVTEATVRVRPVGEDEDGVVVLLPTFEAGMAVCRAIVQGGVPVEVMRLSDPAETSFATSLVELAPMAARASRVLFGMRRFRQACALMLGWSGRPAEIRRCRQLAGAIWRSHGGVAVGRGGWRRWRHDRFRHPYLRDTLLSAGWGVDTFETAAPWSVLAHLWSAVRRRIDEEAHAMNAHVALLCHLSHAYEDGASLYFTFFWPLWRQAEVAQWRSLKTAATRALLDAGGTLSHHHGVGSMHAPYLGEEIGERGLAVLASVAGVLDPAGVLNPGTLLAERVPASPESADTPLSQGERGAEEE